jgi:WhiB family redox-sensing transcriptional regulator
VRTTTGQGPDVPAGSPITATRLSSTAAPERTDLSGFRHRRLPEAGDMPAPGLSGRSPGWMRRGACQGEDPELFSTVAAVGPALTQVIAAEAVCSWCAVRAACLSYALATGQAGIWGGTTQEERRAMGRSSGLPARERSTSPGAPPAAKDDRSIPGGQ